MLVFFYLFFICVFLNLLTFSTDQISYWWQ